MRNFEDRPAVRERVPLLIGLFGASGSGKTFSALRLASGIQSVTGGEVFYIDTEAGRALHYADRFRFRHVPFAAPFGPLDYLAAIEHCVKKGAGVIVVDSMSHEHEGPGGVLETHEAEVERLHKAWNTSRDAVKLTAWARPKQDRRRLINTILQLKTNFVFCFRAKEKLAVKGRGEKPEPLGWMPIAGEEFIYEMTACGLLMPNAGGVPSWNPDGIGERSMVKLPDFAREMFPPNKPLDEDTGAKLAAWAAGTPIRGLDELLRDFAQATDAAAVKALRAEARVIWGGLSKDDREQLTAEMEIATKRVKGAGDAAA